MNEFAYFSFDTMSHPWPPSPYLQDYQGPYPKHELTYARQTLIWELTQTHSVILERVKPRLGINSRFGPAERIPPIRRPSGPSVQCPVGVRNSLNATQKSASASSPPVDTSHDSGVGDIFVTESPSEKGALEKSSPSTLTKSVSLDSGNAQVKKLTSPLNSTPVSTKSVKSATIATPDSSSKIGQFWPVLSQIDSATPLSVKDASGGLLKRKLHDDWSPTGEDGPKRARTLVSLKSESQSTDVTSGSHVNGEVVLKLYKCDMCMFNSMDKDKTLDHLLNSKHFTASLYNAKRSATHRLGFDLISIETMMAVKNAAAKNSTLVIACPDCRDVFEDIFMCGIHHKYTHGSANGLYSVCPVIRNEKIAVSLEPRCNTCGVTFDKHSSLHKHWQQEEMHHPLNDAVKSPNVFALYFCPGCRHCAFNFLTCKCHIVSCSQACQLQSEGVVMEVQHVMQPTRREELPPFNTENGHIDGVQAELQVFRVMKKHFGKVLGTTQKLKNIRERVKTLRLLAGETGQDLDFP